MTGRTHTIVIPEIPMGFNDRERTHWRQLHTEKKRIEELIWAECHRHGIRQIATPAYRNELYKASRKILIRQRRGVSVEIQKAQSNGQRDDEANIDARAKSILDALVGLGQLIDDDQTWLAWGGVTESRHPDGPRTVITITEDVPA